MATCSSQSFSQFLRRFQWAIPILSDTSRVHHLVAQFCICPSYASERFFEFKDTGRRENLEKILPSRSNCVLRYCGQSSVVALQAGRRSLFGTRGGWTSARISGQVVSLSSSAFEIRDEVAVRRQTSAIGYEVLGKCTPEGSQIHPQTAFAVIRVGSHQFKVSPGDIIYTEKLKYADISDKLLLSKVLLMGSLEQTIIGRPIVPAASVIAAVEEIALDEKYLSSRRSEERTTGEPMAIDKN